MPAARKRGETAATAAEAVGAAWLLPGEIKVVARAKATELQSTPTELGFARLRFDHMQRSVGRSRIISFVPACGILGVTKMAEALVQAGPTVLAAFLAALVEAVEALTVVLAVASVRGWRAAGAGALCGLALLALIVATLGPLLN